MEGLLLSEYLAALKQHISRFQRSVWVKAEINELKYSGGHCYLTLIEKSDEGFAAKISAHIWKNKVLYLRPMFEQITGQELTTGLSILVQVTPNFSEKYGLSLDIEDIDPTYTMGDMAMRRAETIKKLQADGVWEMNKSIDFPILPQRVAIISSPTAAGYGDFCNQLLKNEYGYKFYVHLFPAIMQGESAPQSVMDALDAIYSVEDLFDVVVIIRGGGGTADMLAFDDYDLASCCAQFPLPIISGIGHDRDECVLDLVANQRCKTPTAVAAFLVEHVHEQGCRIEEIETALIECVRETLNDEKDHLQQLSTSISQSAQVMLSEVKMQLNTADINLHNLPLQLIQKEQHRLKVLSADIRTESNQVTLTERGKLEMLKERLKNLSANILSKQTARLELDESKLKLSSPEAILKKGYTLTLFNGKAVKSAQNLKSGDQIETLFADGKVTSTIDK